METSTILYITLALIAALGFAFFQYLYPKKNISEKNYVFFGLRATAIFLVLLLLINPKITSTEVEIEKPELILLNDNSQSISYLEQDNELKELSQSLSANEKLLSNFQVSNFNFGEDISLEDSLDFSSGQTDIYSALSETQEIFSESNAAIILLSDGNQSMGRDFRYFRSGNKTKIYPLVIGDTTTYQDLSIERINSNRYAFLNNRFPVEVFLNYSGEDEVEGKFSIKTGNTVVYSENIKFSKGSQSKIVRTDLPANSLGVKTYNLEIEAISGEKNLVNNKQNFAVEVIDERTSVLILSDIPHPDLGAIKKSIETNQQRSAEIKYTNNDNFQISDYQLIILYQVNRKFNDILSEILEKRSNYLIITGTITDWNYLNNLDLGYSRNATSQPQDIFPVYNPTFSSFQFEDIGFSDFPPLVDKFGPLEIEQKQFNVMLFQELQGVKTGEPLMGVSQNTPKSGFLFGENIWRWRAKSYLDNKSFEEFDNFFGKLIQNLASNNSRQRLTIESENFYYGNQNVIISAQYFDENYQFDAGANLKITLKNKETEESITSDLILKNNFFQFDAGDMPAGEYSFTVRVQNENLTKTGTFEVIDYNTEQQFVSANLSGMQSFADNNATQLYFQDQLDELVNSLLQNDKFKPIQISRQKTVPLIDWYYLLFILIAILAAEWFYRKYLGLI